LQSGYDLISRFHKVTNCVHLDIKQNNVLVNRTLNNHELSLIDLTMATKVGDQWEMLALYPYATQPLSCYAIANAGNIVIPVYYAMDYWAFTITVVLKYLYNFGLPNIMSVYIQQGKPFRRGELGYKCYHVDHARTSKLRNRYTHTSVMNIDYMLGVNNNIVRNRPDMEFFKSIVEKLNDLCWVIYDKQFRGQYDYTIDIIPHDEKLAHTYGNTTFKSILNTVYRHTNPLTLVPVQESTSDSEQLVVDALNLRCSTYQSIPNTLVDYKYMSHLYKQPEPTESNALQYLAVNLALCPDTSKIDANIRTVMQAHPTITESQLIDLLPDKVKSIQSAVTQLRSRFAKLRSTR